MHPLSGPLKLTVLDAISAAATPDLTICLTPTAKHYPLNGDFLFCFKISILSHSDDIITICIYQTPLKGLQGLGEVVHTVDQNSGHEVERSYKVSCWGFDGPLILPDVMFEDFVLGLPYERMFWLEGYNEVTGNGRGLRVFEPERRYKVRVTEALRGRFDGGGGGGGGRV
ncbi:hypothetical protein BDW02DRAFT_598423 [Decorospora gaudefroyi]|uniref:Uncharacterized protein n=1 Tax=Decorospora gaudefroyi TaxID=184978 RepID=A0A6A5KFV2_9PLEO|nr:hypothetical protein BDW02DRAFT_598423 [Decorospora gaudefroyi]